MTVSYENDDTIEHYYWILHETLNTIRNKKFNSIAHFNEWLGKEFTDTMDAINEDK